MCYTSRGKRSCAQLEQSLLLQVVCHSHTHPLLPHTGATCFHRAWYSRLSVAKFNTCTAAGRMQYVVSVRDSTRREQYVPKIFWHHLKVRGLFHSEVLVRCTALSPGRHRTSAWARVPERDTEPWCSYMTIHVFLPFSGAAAAAASFSAADSLWEPLPSFHDTQRCDSGILDITLSTCMPQPVQVARPHALHFAWRHISNRSRCSLRSAVLPDGRDRAARST